MSKKKEEKEVDAKGKAEDYFDTEEGKEFLKMMRNIKVRPVPDPFMTLSAEAGRRLKTGTVLDDILGQGGIGAKKIIMVYGEYGTGKTQFGYTLLCEAGEEGTVVYINPEFSFSPERITQIAKNRGKDMNKIRENLILVEPEDWLELLACPAQIPSPADLGDRKPISLVIVDSLLCAFDKSPEFMGRQKLPKRSQMIRLLLAELRKVARLHDCPVFVTDQIQEVPDVTKWTPSYLRQKEKGGPTVQHVPDIIIYLRKAASGTRIARLMDSYELPVGERVYIINDKGIDDVPKDLKDKIERKSKKEEQKELEEAQAEADTVLSTATEGSEQVA